MAVIHTHPRFARRVVRRSPSQAKAISRHRSFEWTGLRASIVVWSVAYTLCVSFALVTSATASVLGPVAVIMVGVEIFLPLQMVMAIGALGVLFAGRHPKAKWGAHRIAYTPALVTLGGAVVTVGLIFAAQAFPPAAVDPQPASYWKLQPASTHTTVAL